MSNTPGSAAPAPIAHALIDADLVIVALDEAFASCLALTRDASVGRSVLDLLHADDHGAAEAFLAGAWQSGQTLSVTQRLIRSDGHAVPVALHVSRLDIGGDRYLSVTCRPLPAARPSHIEAQWHMARLLLNALHGGKRAFGETLIGNPATEILLLAYIAEAQAQTIEAGAIAPRIDLSWSLTRRWLLALVDAGFVEIELPGPIAATSPVRLSPRALGMIETIFAALIAVVHESLVVA